METDQIHRLLQKCLSEGRPQDWQQLRDVLKPEEQAPLRKELFRLGKLTPEDLNADAEKMWQHIAACEPKGINRKLGWQKLGRYAAILVLPLIIGGLLYTLKQLSQESTVKLTALLEPGYKQAILKFENGERVDLASISQDTLLLRNGVSIHLDSLKSITYHPVNTGTKELAYNSIEVPRGGEYRLVLPDGSVVWLNSDSELKFPMNFTGSQRKVFLKGEAYFEVAKNPALPFVVEVGPMEVKVLGTRFNINANRADGVLQTTLVSGSVAVTHPESCGTVLLLPDQQAELREGNLSVRTVDAHIVTAWREGKFYFESESLEEIAAQLERWYDIHFFFTRESLKQDEFTGVIRRDYTANEILRIISKTTNVKFDIKERTVTVY